MISGNSKTSHISDIICRCMLLVGLILILLSAFRIFNVVQLYGSSKNTRYVEHLEKMEKGKLQRIFFYAIARDNYHLIYNVLDKGWVDINYKGGRQGHTPLHIAAIMGNINMFDYLVSHGADINAKNNYGDTPLKEACSVFSKRDFALSIENKYKDELEHKLFETDK
jgi:Ankyrin repeats (3 copies)